ncbi:MAG: aldehyde dehydrogenase [Rhodobacteraceae bacterium]|nr:MAG: aldehyde dehydrogenase [Paracoccaceae bacterium]
MASEFDADAGLIHRGGRLVPAGAPLIETLDPATLAHVGFVAECPAALAEDVAAEAAAAQRAWGRLDARTRAAHLHRVSQSIEETPFDAVADQMVRDMGKPWPEATGELANVAGVFRYYAELARDEAGKVAGTTEAGSLQMARYEPYGVSVHILPYNFPILLMAWTVAASLAAGNAVIVKPALPTSLTTLRFMAHFDSLPPGVVSCVTGGAEAAQALVASPHTHAVAVTGGVATCRAVAEAAGRGLKPCVAEAGGSDAFIVMPSAPVDAAAAGAVTAAFHLTGQVCTSAERFFVHRDAYDAFLDAFAAKTRALRIGTGFEQAEIGPLVSEAARAKVMRLVDDAVAKGARVVTGGRVPPERNVGWFYEPTILADVAPGMALMREEAFGPVAAVTAVDSFEEALAQANDSPFGLGATLYTHDLAEAMRGAEALEAGMVWVNNPLIDNDALPFGGVKQSGFGRSLGRQGLDAFRRAKMVILDRQATVKDWWYPYPDDWFHGSARGRF